MCNMIGIPGIREHLLLFQVSYFHFCLYCICTPGLEADEVDGATKRSHEQGLF